MVGASLVWLREPTRGQTEDDNHLQWVTDEMKRIERTEGSMFDRETIFGDENVKIREEIPGWVFLNLYLVLILSGISIIGSVLSRAYSSTYATVPELLGLGATEPLGSLVLGLLGIGLMILGAALIRSRFLTRDA